MCIIDADKTSVAATTGVERLDRVKGDSVDGEFGISENYFSSPEVSDLPVDKYCI